MSDTSRTLFVDSARGIYGPQRAMRYFTDKTREAIALAVGSDAVDVVMRGPDEEFYDEAWEEILRVRWWAPHWPYKVMCLDQDEEGNIWLLMSDKEPCS